MSRLFILCSIFCHFVGYGQQFDQIVPLEASLAESSGLIYLNGKIITHVDSQGDAALYEVDSTTGFYVRKVVLANATNTDWEDITCDSTYIFIGDFGNNGGNRTNLKIYRILISDYLNTPNDTVFCDTIQYAYADQTDFTYNQNATNWDCEAMASIGDSLYLFTKNWANLKTYVYPLSKLPGTYLSAKIDSIDVQGWITGADFHTGSNRLVLCGYTQFPFVVEMNDPMAGPFGQNNFVRYNLPNSSLLQLEAIATYSDNTYYLTAETFQSVDAKLYRLKGLFGNTLGIGGPWKSDFVLFPNPTNAGFSLEFPSSIKGVQITVSDESGKTIPVTFDKTYLGISTSDDLPPGVYFIRIETEKKLIIERLIVK